MKIYIEIVFILNFWIDFLLLLSLTFVLKKKTSIKKIILASLTGSSLSLIFLINIDVYFSLLLKLIISILMILISFKYENIKVLIQDIIYFYLLSIILAGFIYLIDENTSINNNFYTNFIGLLILTPLILFIYIRISHKEKTLYSKIYKVEILYKNKNYQYRGFIDSGNRLYDYSKRPIQLLYTKDIEFNYKNGLLVPFETASGESILKCIIVDKLIIGNKEYKKVVVGLTNKKIGIDGIDILLHPDML